MNTLISIIIPNYNGGRTIGYCLDSVFRYKDDACEVIVVDDCSDDASAEIIARYPYTLIRLAKRSGAAAARNAGAGRSRGQALFFIDADCVLKQDTIAAVRRHLAEAPLSTVIGGTYTPRPPDPGFFSFFQSVFINYSETRNSGAPDYVASHALVISAETFRSSGGFREDFLPILEDVEFSHRLRAAGHRLLMDPALQVGHIFNFTGLRSLRNAARKTEYWFAYSLVNRDLLSDSGTASREIKATGILWLASVLLVLVSILLHTPGLLLLIVLLGAGIVINRQLFKAFREAGGTLFAVQASAYYLFVYPGAIWTGTLRGLLHVFRLQQRGNAADDRA